MLDASGLPVPEAAITAHNTQTGARRQAVTDAQGRYAISAVAIGTYLVTADRQGFQQQSYETPLGVGETLALDFTMPVQTVNESVEVSAEAPVVDPNGSTGAGFLNRQILSLPINGRDYARFSLLTSGAVARTNFVADLSFNGLHTTHNQFTIDGVDASRVDQPFMANGFERGARLLTGSLDSIQEFRVQTSNYQAQYGRAAGSYINIATRAGENALHGSVFEFFRNNALDARNFFNVKPAPQAQYRFNDFGANAGGPIRRDRTFFFVNYEGSRQRIGITGSGSTPSAELRSQVLASSPALAPIIGEYPQGTSQTVNPLVNTFTTVRSSSVREDTGSVRLDHNPSQNNSVFLRVNVNDTRVFGPLFGVSASALGLLDYQNVPVRTTNVALHDQHVFSPSLLNETLLGAQRWGSSLIADNPYPLTVVGGLTIVPGSRGRSRSNNTSLQAGDAISYVTGGHTLRSGVTVYRSQVDYSSSDTSLVLYASLPDFIANSASSVTYAAPNPGSATRAYSVGAFVQDTWQARPGLTLDLGLRYDYETPPYDPANRARTFDTRTLTLAPPGTPYFRSNRNDWGPRFAVGWRPSAHLVVRAGYGVFWQNSPLAFASTSIPANTIAGNTSILRAQAPGLGYPFASLLTQGTAPLPAVTGFNWDQRDVQAQQWNLTLAWQLAESASVHVAYVGDRGINLARNLDINLFDPALGRRPIPNFSSVTIATATGQSTYHSLQLSYYWRVGRALRLDFNYTSAHAIDDVQDAGLFPTQPQDNNNFRAERGNGSGDIRHSVSYNVIYELPFHGRNVFLAGWRIASLGLLRTGIPETIYIPLNTYGNSNFVNQRPNAVLGVSPYAANQSVDQWFNPAAFALPSPGSFGNLGRNTVFGPGLAQIDFAMLKDISLSESSKAQFRVELFNLPNHPNFAQPNSTFGSAAFGRILSTLGRTIGMGTSRQIQLALRLSF